MTTTISLSAPILWHDKSVREITLKPPLTGAMLRHGEPFSWAPTSDGNAMRIENPETIRKYFDGCVDHEGGAALIDVLPLVDGYKAKAALLDFFTRAQLSAYADTLDSSSSS